MTTPISFYCEAELKVSGQTIFDGIRDVQQWTSFSGYGFLPGIKQARYHELLEGMVGSIIHVENTDGSTHQERIVKWVPGQSIEMELGQFSKPLANIASHFIERWEFFEQQGKPFVRRYFDLYPKTLVTKPFLWFIALMMRRAIQRHIQLLADG